MYPRKKLKMHLLICLVITVKNDKLILKSTLFAEISSCTDWCCDSDTVKKDKFINPTCKKSDRKRKLPYWFCDKVSVSNSIFT
jgi:hypothetical protein